MGTNKRPEATAAAKPEVASKPKISKTSTAFASMRAFGGFKPAAEKPASASTASAKPATASKPPVLTRKPSKTSMAAASYVRGSAFDSKPARKKETFNSLCDTLKKLKTYFKVYIRKKQTYQTNER